VPARHPSPPRVATALAVSTLLASAVALSSPALTGSAQAAPAGVSGHDHRSSHSESAKTVKSTKSTKSTNRIKVDALGRDSYTPDQFPEVTAASAGARDVDALSATVPIKGIQGLRQYRLNLSDWSLVKALYLDQNLRGPWRILPDVEELLDDSEWGEPPEKVLERTFGGKFTPRDQFRLDEELLETRPDGPVGFAGYTTRHDVDELMLLVKHDGQIHYLDIYRPGYADTERDRPARSQLRFLATHRLPGGPPPALAATVTRYADVPRGTWFRMSPKRWAELVATAPRGAYARLGGHGKRDAGSLLFSNEGDEVEAEVHDELLPPERFMVYSGGRVQNLERLPE
jgi:hypothetical protein